MSKEAPATGGPGPCLAARIGDWFREQHAASLAADPSSEVVAHARQTNMALALAASKWLEFEALHVDPAPLMRAWVARTLERAEARRAGARAEAMRLVGAWLDECVRELEGPSRAAGG